MQFFRAVVGYLEVQNSMKMRGEDALATHRVKLLGNGRGNAGSRVDLCASAELVHEDQAAAGRVQQYTFYLAHLHGKCALSLIYATIKVRQKWHSFA
jgi:hypothetical protein